MMHLWPRSQKLDFHTLENFRHFRLGQNFRWPVDHFSIPSPASPLVIHDNHFDAVHVIHVTPLIY